MHQDCVLRLHFHIHSAAAEYRCTVNSWLHHCMATQPSVVHQHLAFAQRQSSLFALAHTALRPAAAELDCTPASCVRTKTEVFASRLHQHYVLWFALAPRLSSLAAFAPRRCCSSRTCTKTEFFGLHLHQVCVLWSVLAQRLCSLMAFAPRHARMRVGCCRDVFTQPLSALLTAG